MLLKNAVVGRECTHVFLLINRMNPLSVSIPMSCNTSKLQIIQHSKYLNTCDILQTLIHRDQDFLLKSLAVVMIGQRFFISRLFFFISYIITRPYYLFQTTIVLKLFQNLQHMHQVDIQTPHTIFANHPSSTRYKIY